MLPDFASRREARGRPAPVLRQALLRFATWSLLFLLLLGIGAVVVGRSIAEAEALRDARSRAAGLATGVVAPLVDARVRASDPRAVGSLAATLSHRIRDGSIAHIRLWDEHGRVIWADQASLVGKDQRLDTSAQELFGTHGDASAVSMTDPKDTGSLVRVHVGVRDSEGVPLVVETHMTPESVQRDAAAIIREILPLGLGGLLLFQIAIVPIAVTLARQVRDAQRDRDQAARHALLAPEAERRRIAQDLHDGVVQDLAGIGYALPAVSSMIVSGPRGEEARATADEVIDILHRDVEALRSLLVDIYPPNLSTVELPLLLDGLAEVARHAGTEVTVRAHLDEGVPVHVKEMIYRVVQEGLRNVASHARASHAEVVVARNGGEIVVSVSDDGRGLGQGGADDGHLGLRLLADWLAGAGSRLTLGAGPEGGATLTAQLAMS